MKTLAIEPVTVGDVMIRVSHMDSGGMPDPKN